MTENLNTTDNMNENDEYYIRLQSIIDLLNDKDNSEKEKEEESLKEDDKEEEKKEKTSADEDEKMREIYLKIADQEKRAQEISAEFERLILEFLTDYPDSPEAMFLIGRQAFLKKSLVVAWESFNKAWDLDSNVLEYADAIAITSSHLGKIKEGAFFAKLSLILQPHPILKRMTVKNLTDYKKSLLQTYDSTANFTNMLRHFYLGEFTKVINILESEIQVNSKHAPSYYHLGVSYYRLGNTPMALDNMRTAYLLEKNNLQYLPLLTEICLRLHMYDEALGYLTELESFDEYSMIAKVLKQKYLILNNSYDNSESLTRNIWGNLREIEKQYTSKKLPNYIVTPYTDVYARVGILINSSSLNNTISALIASPDKFHVIFYDVDDAKEKEKTPLEHHVTDYINLFNVDSRSSAMMIRGEGLDLLIDATDYSTNGSYTNYAFDDVAPLKLSWLSHLEKPFIDGILYSDNHNKLDNYFQLSDKKPYKIRNAVSLPIPFMFATVNEPPAFKNGYITLGIVADQENLTPLFLSQLTTLLREIPFVNILFGYNDFLTESYKNELFDYFAGLKLNQRISFPVYPEDPIELEGFNHKIEFNRSIDIFLNGGKAHIEALAYSLFSGVPSFCLLDGSGESVIAVSTLASANADENRVCNTIENCIEEILKIIEDPENLAQVRSELIQSIPNSLLFNPNEIKNSFWEDIYNITQSVDSAYDKIS